MSDPTPHNYRFPTRSTPYESENEEKTEEQRISEAERAARMWEHGMWKEGRTKRC